MTKTTALYLACDELMLNYYETGCCESCPVFDECQYKEFDNAHEDCIKTLMEYFNKQAEVSDGWGIVKNIYDVIEEQKNFIDKTYDDETKARLIHRSHTRIQEFIEHQLQQVSLDV